MSTTERMQSDDSRSEAHALATVASSTRIQLPTGWAGKYIWMQAVAGSGAAVDVGVNFGSSTVTVANSSLSTVTSEALSANATAPDVYLVAGALPQRIRVPSDATHFAHIAGATTGYLRFGLATGTG